MKEEEMEAPECPVCLQSYDDNTIPRVLPCGHSACQSCLAHLHLLHSPTLPKTTLRCPSCTQLVKFPHPQGPTALPKNIDLLRFSLLFQPQNPTTKPNCHTPSPRRRFPFPPQKWSDEVYAAWKDWVLPEDAVLMEGNLLKSDFVGLGSSAVMRCRLVENQEVGFVEVGRFELNDSDLLLEYSYVGKVMSVLSLMNDTLRNEISSLLGVSFRNSRVCNVFGLWLDVENDGFLYLVCQRMKNGLSNSGNFGFGVEDCGSCLGSLMISVEFCEVLISLHSEGFVCGCLGLSCFCFDEFGHVCVDIGEVLVIGRKLRCVVEGVQDGRKVDVAEAEAIIVELSNMVAFVSPEVLLELLHRESFEIDKNGANCTVCYGTDVWILACVLIRLLTGDKFPVEMYNYLRVVFQEKNERVSECKIVYLQWVETINATLEPLSVSGYASVCEILVKCLDFDPSNRPLVIDVWKCIKGLNIHHNICRVSSLNNESRKENVGQCLVLGELCNTSNDLRNEAKISKTLQEDDDCKPDLGLVGQVKVDNVVKGVSSGKVQCKVLQGHLDCITALCVGGGYLFSSSFDKTINVWSLQDFTHVHTFRGHEHRVMALVFVNEEKPVCISADSGGGIFSWEINEPLAQEPLKKWYEEKDWRYSGIHALAVSENGCLYTGSGDRLIKAWLLKDHTLMCSMEGHKSVVSTLALCNGVLYSGSWDGTVRLWCLHDHSPLAVFSEDIPGTVSSVLSVFADQNMIIAAHENGCIKIWMNDVLKKSMKFHTGAIFALAMEEKWLFLGGWDKTVKVQEITGGEPGMDVIEVGSIVCDSVITAMLCVQGVLFVGCSNKLIKVELDRGRTLSACICV
ncbi:hypothetical protein BVRB_005290 isoform A [Beta vulgaris subsp. vulgaris]|uniref:RING-type domain-containing protein n=2 Tax=Beta vulgaris subsp. vulgaris TaxID=3555 RepID=A0A0J8B435_BETVV|nr:hypothetical protein BVRB_005290 isoform A [Beta vulgaris subsp. vulgaris]